MPISVSPLLLLVEQHDRRARSVRLDNMGLDIAIGLCRVLDSSSNMVAPSHIESWCMGYIDYYARNQKGSERAKLDVSQSIEWSRPVAVQAKREWSFERFRISSCNRTNAFFPSPYKRGILTSNNPIRQ
jgi:hypothetical protein